MEGFEQHWAVIEQVNALLLDGEEFSETLRGALKQAVDDLRCLAST
jgi:hypothetical protein